MRPLSVVATVSPVCALLCAAVACADVTGTNMLLVQLGNMPFVEPRNRTALYDQVNLEAAVHGGYVGVRFETSRTSTGTPEYSRITQRYADWTTERLRVRVGTFTSLLGRGLTQRAFEVPGVVLEDPGVRTQHAFRRDVDGVLIAARAGRVEATALYGSPTTADEPRDLANEGPAIAGGEVAVRAVRGVRVGATYLRVPDVAHDTELVSGFADVDALDLIAARPGAWTLYAEYAGRNLQPGEWWRLRLDRATSHALYASLTGVAGPFGVSIEGKDYSGFRLGVNDPPSLVRQQTYALLNRETHVLDAGDEVGHQIEVSYAVLDLGSIVTNWSRGDSHVSAGGGQERGVRYEERFVELATRADRWPGVSAAVFYDGMREELKQERRATGGGALTLERGAHSVSIDAERSTGRRQFLAAPFHDDYASCTLAWAGHGSLGLVLERSNDPDFTDHADTIELETAARTVIGGVLSATLSPEHELRVFAGERRGGLACTAGSCYLVPAFRGLEVALASRF